jgi:hypothetical protein
MEQRKYPGSPGTVETAQGTLEGSESRPGSLMIIMPVMPRPPLGPLGQAAPTVRYGVLQWYLRYLAYPYFSL